MRRVMRNGGPWVIATLVLLVAGAGLYAFTGAAASEPSKAPPPTAADISAGNPDASVAVVEYSDFQCPFCAEYAPILAQLRQEYGDRVQFVFRFFPLANHEFGMISAQAAYAAHKQGKFWEMHDLLFDRQDEWTQSSDPRTLFDSYAQSIGLDLEQFHKDIDAQATIDFITSQRAQGEQAGVSHTPWFVVDGSSVLPRSIDEFRRLIEDAL